MTRRDYVLLAKVCARHRLPYAFLLDLAIELGLRNSRFDREIFLENAQYTEDIAEREAQIHEGASVVKAEIMED